MLAECLGDLAVARAGVGRDGGRLLLDADIAVLVVLFGAVGVVPSGSVSVFALDAGSWTVVADDGKGPEYSSASQTATVMAGQGAKINLSLTR